MTVMLQLAESSEAERGDLHVPQIPSVHRTRKRALLTRPQSPGRGPLSATHASTKSLRYLDVHLEEVVFGLFSIDNFAPGLQVRAAQHTVSANACLLAMAIFIHSV